MSCPSRRMRPAMGRMKPLIVLSAVDLPLPFAPSRATTSPRRTARSTPRRTWMCPYPATRLSTASSGGVASVAKVGFQHFAIPRHLRGRSVGDDLAVVEDDDPVRYRHDELDRVLDEDDGDPFLPHQPADDAEQLLADGRRQPDGGLVEEKERRARLVAARSVARAAGMPNSTPKNPVGTCVWRPASTFSSAVSSPKSPPFWKVRRTPFADTR